MPWIPFGHSRKLVDVTAQLRHPISAGTLHLQRNGAERRLIFNDVRFTESGRGSIIIGLDVSDRPRIIFRDVLQGVSAHARVTEVGNVMAYDWTAGTQIHGQLWWSTEGVA